MLDYEVFADDLLLVVENLLGLYVGVDELPVVWDDEAEAGDCHDESYVLPSECLEDFVHFYLVHFIPLL